MKSCDLIIKDIAQLVTCASHQHPKRGKQMRDIGIISNGALAIQDGLFLDVGDSIYITANYQAEKVISANNKVIIPGLVDCHTHTIHDGNRYDEFEMRISGKTYMEIMEAGGGIMNTVRATRSASFDTLVASGEAHLNEMLKLGTTTVEIKTGYGLNTETENKLLQVIFALAEKHPMTIIPTYLGAHTKPTEYASNQEYLRSIFEEGLPSAYAIYQQSELKSRNRPFFVDIFVEKGVFSVADMEAYFTVASQHDLKLKAHVDQFEHLGAVPIAVQMGAISVDHLEATPTEDLDILAQSNTIGVMLPTVNFNLGLTAFGNARHLIDAEGILALATDFNPGSSPTLSLPMVMAIACRYQRLLPSEALNACTINAAAAIGMIDHVGSIEVGKQADFLLLNTTDYRSMIVEFGRNFVEQVYIKGNLVWNTSS